MIYFPVKSLPNSAIPSGFNTYKIRKNNPLHFQHLQNSSDLFILKPLKPPLKSTLTRPLSLTPVQSTLTENRGRGVGVGLVSLTTLLLFSSLFCRARQLISLLLNSFRTLCKKCRGVPRFALFSDRKRPTADHQAAVKSRAVPKLFPKRIRRSGPVSAVTRGPTIFTLGYHS